MISAGLCARRDERAADALGVLCSGRAGIGIARGRRRSSFTGLQFGFRFCLGFLLLGFELGRKLLGRELLLEI